jgi:lipopolysaccharide export system protein LptA
MKNLWNLWIFLGFVLNLVYASPENPESFEVSAQQSIECHDKEHVCRAVGAACAKKGKVTLCADTINVYYSVQDKKRTIEKIQAIGHAKLEDPSGVVSGEHLEYWVKSQILEVTGPKNILKTPRFSLTSTKKIRYCHLTHQGEAWRAHWEQEGSSMAADWLQANFTPIDALQKEHNAFKDLPSLGSHGHLELHSIKAKGHVKIVGKKSSMGRADEGYYDACTQKIQVRGNVSLMQETHFAKGETGVFDLQTHCAYLEGQGTKRVQLLLNPQTMNRLKRGPKAVKQHSGEAL